MVESSRHNQIDPLSVPQFRRPARRRWELTPLAVVAVLAVERLQFGTACRAFLAVFEAIALPSTARTAETAAAATLVPRAAMAARAACVKDETAHAAALSTRQARRDTSTGLSHPCCSRASMAGSSRALRRNGPGPAFCSVAAVTVPRPRPSSQASRI